MLAMRPSTKICKAEMSSKKEQMQQPRYTFNCFGVSFSK